MPSRVGGEGRSASGETIIRTEALLLDFDGTLVESLPIKLEAFRALYAPYGREVAERAVAHYHANTGVSRLVRIRHCHEELLGETPSEAVVGRLSELFGTMVEDRVVACDWVAGAEAFLERHAGTLPLFLVSATPQAELERILERRRIDHYFTDILGSPPDKIALVHEIVSTHWHPPERLVMVGDGRADLDAAAANGVRFLGRVPPGQANPFPDGTPIVADLTGLAAWLADESA